MMLKKIFLIVLICFSLQAQAANQIPINLRTQIERLVGLLSDSQAVGYPESTDYKQYQLANKLGSDDSVLLAVFAIEGYGGGNNFIQYLAIFEPEVTENGSYNYSLIDVIKIGSQGWRTIEKLNAKVARTKSGDIKIVLNVLENINNDAPNFPSKRKAIVLNLINGRIVEIK